MRRSPAAGAEPAAGLLSVHRFRRKFLMLLHGGVRQTALSGPLL